MAKKLVPVICAVVQNRRYAVQLHLRNQNIKSIAVPEIKRVVETIVVMFVAMVTVVQKIQLVAVVDVVVHKVQNVVEVVVVQENAVMPMESV
jgi:hypothetical protein